MNLNQFVFVIGLFGIPLLLLWAGHHVRRGSAARRRMFWGAVVGHCVAGTLALTAGLIQPEMWSTDDTVRGAVGFWAMLGLPAAGALFAGLRPNRR